MLDHRNRSIEAIWMIFLTSLPYGIDVMKAGVDAAGCWSVVFYSSEAARHITIYSFRWY
jgi:hypothetical protein